MVFSWLQQGFRPDAIQECSVRRSVKQTVETPAYVIVKHDFRTWVGILAIVILHKIVPVYADALDRSPMSVKIRKIACDCRNGLASDEAIIVLDRVADVCGKHQIDFSGFDGLVSLLLVVVADEFDFQTVFQLQQFDDFRDRFDACAYRIAVFVLCGKREVVVEIADAQYLVVRNPFFLLQSQIAAQGGIGEIPFLQPGEIIKVVVEDFLHCGIDVVDQIGPSLSHDQIIRGRTDFFDSRKIAFRQHAEFQVEIDFPGEQIGFFLRNVFVFDNLQIDVLFLAPFFQ